MEGGKISGNTAGTDGGAVHVNKAKGSVTIKGGEISSNVSGGQGGAINTVKGAFVTMDDGTVSGNTASTYGGGILVTGAGGSFTMNGGTISGNSVTKSMGGGVQIGADGTMIMNGGTITGNKAKSGGSGVNVGNSTAKLTMKGGTIQENTGYDISLQSTANEKLVLDGKVTVGTVYIYGGTPYITATGSFQADSPVALSKASAITDSYQLIHFDDSVTDKAAVLAMFAPVETEGWSLNGEGTIVTGSIAAQLSRCLRGIFANLGGDRNV